MNNSQKLKAHAIAQHYGYDGQARQTVEELSELIQAICKERRYADVKTEDIENDFNEYIAEEIADVEIMLEQLKWLLGCQRYVEEIIENKLLRQVRRIASESNIDNRSD